MNGRARLTLLAVLILLAGAFFPPARALALAPDFSLQVAAAALEMGDVSVPVSLVTVDGMAYVPASLLAHVLQVGTHWDAESGELRMVSGEANELLAEWLQVGGGLSLRSQVGILIVGDKQADVTFLRFNGALYVPLDQVIAMAGYAVTWDEAGTHAAITTGTGSEGGDAPVGKSSAWLTGAADYADLDVPTSLSGRVTDGFGRPVAGAEVYAVRLDAMPALPCTAFTDSDGRYTLPNIAPGSYRIVMLQDGFEPFVVEKRTLASTESGWKVDGQLRKAVGTVRWETKETDRVVYHYRTGQAPSQQEIDYEAARLQEIEAFFGVKVSAPIQFYQAASQEEAAALAGMGAGARTDAAYQPDKNAIVTIGPAFNWHETTHAVEHMLNPSMNYALSEGLATFFGWGKIGSPVQWRSSLTQVAREDMRSGTLPSVDTLLSDFTGQYAENGALVDFLLRHYSRQQFLDLIQALPFRPDSVVTDDVLHQIYGKSAFELYNEWRLSLGGNAVAADDPSIPVKVQFGGTIQVKGMTTADIAGKGYSYSFIIYGDKELTKRFDGGGDTAESVPQAWSNRWIHAGTYYFLFFLDKNGDFRLDADEPRAVVPVTLKAGHYTGGINVTLELPKN